MKKITIFLTFIFGIALLFNACQKMEDIHSEYLEGGDIIYAAKPLIIQSFAGQKRVGLKYYLINAVNVDKCIVEWNDGAESQTIDIAPNVPLDSIQFMINNLEEKSYIFKIYTVDKHGNRSIKEQITGSSYDEKYIAGLTNRALIGIEGGGTVDSLIVTWGTPSEGHTGLELTYNNTDGVAVTKMVMPEEESVVIRGWESESEMSYRSFYVPEENAIDTFAAAPSTTMLPLFIDFKGTPVDKTNWTIVDFSTEEPAEANWGPPIQGLAIAAIDNDNGTFWHSAWESANPPHPHHFTIDFGAVVKMTGFELVKRNNKNDCQKTFTVEVSLDNVNFTSLGTYTYEQANASQKYQTPSLPMAKYIRYTALEGHTGANHTHLAEFNVEGQVASKLDRSGWEIVDFSSEEAGGEGPVNGYLTAAFDDDINTFWHTTWSTASPVYPHHFTIDMKNTVKMLAVDCARRQGNGGGHTKFQILTSNDGENFTDQGTFDFNSKINDVQLFPLAFLPEARYFKFVALEGPNNYTFLAEFNVYGQVL